MEDLLGAGAVVSALAARDGFSESPEAAAARAGYETTTSVADGIRRSASGVELSLGGFDEDIEIAVEVDAGDTVPVLLDGSFQRA